MRWQAHVQHMEVKGVKSLQLDQHSTDHNSSGSHVIDPAGVATEVDVAGRVTGDCADGDKANG